MEETTSHAWHGHAYSVTRTAHGHLWRYRTPTGGIALGDFTRTAGQARRQARRYLRRRHGWLG